MTLATTATWDLNRDDLTKNGLHLCGILNAAQVPSPEQLALGAIFLGAELLSMQLRGVVMRLTERTEKAITAGMTSFASDADTIDIEKDAVVRNASNLDMPCAKIFRAEWQTIGDKSIVGQPSRFYVEEGAGGTLTVYLHPVPDQAYTFIYPRVKRPRDLSSGTLSLDAPPSWLTAFGWLIAWKFAVHYKQSLERCGTLKGYFDQYAGEAMEDETPRGEMRFVAAPIFTGMR